MMEPITILSTKKLNASVRQKAAQEGIHFLHDDFIAIHYIEDESVKQSFESLQEHLVFTSQHAVKGFAFAADFGVVEHQAGAAIGVFVHGAAGEVAKRFLGYAGD